MDDRQRLIDLIYEGVTNEEVWKELLAWLVDGLNATGAGLGLQDMVMPAICAAAAAGMYQGLRAVWRERERLLADLVDKI